MRIYVAAPYTAENRHQRDLNIWLAKDFGIRIYELGHEVYVPHCSITADMENEEKDYNRIIEMHIGILTRWAEALFKHGNSKGVNIETRIAKDLNIPIYTKLSQIPRKR